MKTYEELLAELAKEKDKVKRACQDWAETDTNIKETCAKHGIADAHPKEFNAFKTAEECVDELSAKLTKAESRCEALRECLKGCVEALERYPEQPENGRDLVAEAIEAATALLGDGEGRRPFADPSGQNEPKGTDAGGQS